MTPRMIGGEMPHWSDPSPAGGPALREIVTMARGDTLIVGPHSPELIEAVPGGRVTVLVRGLPDAEALAARPGIEVWCGSLEKLPAVPAYDTVLALAGPDRAVSAESAGLAWSDALHLLLAVLRPGGRLLLGCENPAGLHRLLALPAEPGDQSWGAPASDDPTRPVSLGALRDRLTAAGLGVLRDYAAYPAPHAPRALVSPVALGDPGLHGFLRGALPRAAVPDEPMLADPRDPTGQLLNSGLAAELAPGWVVVAGPEGSPPPPEAVFDSGRLERSGGGWAFAGQPVPPGRNLLEALLAAARAHDLPVVRALVTAWQGSDAADIDAGAVVVDADGRMHGFGVAGEPGAALRCFAESAPGVPAELIAAMAGHAPQVAQPRPGGAGSPPAGVFLREVIAERDRLARELGEVRAALDWHDRRLAERDAELARAYRIIALLKGTAPGRAATAVRGALRTGKRAARTALGQIRRS